MIRLSLLGSLDLRAGDGRQILSVLAQPKRVALLAYLAANRDFVRRDTLLGLFWPESDEERARHALRQSIYTLRRSLGIHALASRGDEELSIDRDHLECDVTAFEDAVRDGRAEEAIELYRGGLLEGFFLSDAPEFEKWLDGRRTTLRNQAAEAAWTVARKAEDAGERADAVAWARKAADFAPDDESSVQRLVGLLDRVGDRAAALRAYEAFAWRLENELGLEPSPETQALVSEIRGREAAATPSVGAGPQTPTEISRSTADQVHAEPSLPDESLLTGAPKVTSEFKMAAAQPGNQSVGSQGAPETTAATSAEGASGATGTDVADGEPKKHRVLMGMAVAALAVAAVIVDFAEIVQWIASRFYGDDSQSGAVEAPMKISTADLDPRRIAVLYFDDHSEGEDKAHLAKGLTEELITRLAAVPTLIVISRNGVKPYRNAPVTVDSIVRVLRTGTIVEGSVIHAGDQIRVTAQLIDASRNSHLGTLRIDRPPAELFLLLDDLATEVSFFLRESLGENIRLKQLQAGTESPEAWGYVQQASLASDDGDWLRARGDTVAAGELYSRADSFLVEASSLDPKWLSPILERGWIAIRQAKRTAGAPEQYDRDWLAAGIARAAQALELSPQNAKALELRGTLYAWIGRASDGEDQVGAFEIAHQDLNEAVALDPRLARAWAALAELYLYQARFQEAHLAISRALDADAFVEEAERIYLLAGRVSLEDRDVDEALFWTNEGFERFPDQRGFAGLLLLILTSSEDLTQSSIDRGWEALRLLESVESPDKWRSHRLKMAAVLGAAGLADSARNVIQWALSADTDDPFAAYYEAKARLSLGEHEQAIGLLTELIDAVPGFRAYLASDWWFETLHTDSSFVALIASKD